jgi:hypothetical protein
MQQGSNAHMQALAPFIRCRWHSLTGKLFLGFVMILRGIVPLTSADT